MNRELELSEAEVLKMATTVVSDNFKSDLSGKHVHLLAAKSFGDAKHRVWAFMIEDGRGFGTIERHWGGLKMIATFYNGSPRSYFFNEDGSRTTNKELKDKQPKGAQS